MPARRPHRRRGRARASTRTNGRWPDHARRAAEHGNLSSPFHSSSPGGGLRRSAEHLRPGAERLRRGQPGEATGLAPYAAVAAGTVQAYRSARKAADNLQIAVASRAVIEQAKGISTWRSWSTGETPAYTAACTRRRQPSRCRVASTSGSAGAVSLVIGAGRLPRPALGTDVIGFRVGPRLMPASSASAGSPQGRGVGYRPRVANPPALPAP